MKELEETLEQKTGKEDFRTLKEEFNQLFKGQKKLAESRTEGKTWADILTNDEVTRNVEDILEKRIKKKDDEEKVRRGRMNNIIMHGIKEAKQGDSQKKKRGGHEENPADI